MSRNDWNKWTVMFEDGMNALERGVRAMEQVLEGDSASDASKASPNDVKKGDGEAVIRLEVPGCGPENVSMTLEDRTLIIRVTNPVRNSTDYFKYRVSSSVDSDAIQATVKNGLLTVVLKQKTEPKKSVTIPVNG